MNARIMDALLRRVKDLHLRELLAGSSVALGFRFIGLGISYVFSLIVTRKFGAEGMGIFALSFTFLSVATIVGKLGLDTALLRFVAEYSAQNNREFVKGIYLKALRMAVPFCMVLTTVLFAASPYIAGRVFGKEHLSPYFRISSLAVLPMALNYINSECLRGLKRIREYAFFYNASIMLFASTVLGVAVFFTVHDVEPIVSFVTGVFIAALASSISWARRAGFSRTKTLNGMRSRDILGVSFPMLLASSLFFIMNWTDTMMLGIFRAEEEVGVYNIAFRIAALTSVTLFAINSIAGPKFAELYGRRDMATLSKVVHHSTKMIFWTSLPILLILFAIPSFVLGIFGSEFKTGTHALLILTFGQFVNAASGSVGYMLQMTGRQKVFQYIIFAATLINVVLNYILIPKFGIIGAALASMASMVFWNMGSVFYVYRDIGIKTYYFPWLKTYAG